MPAVPIMPGKFRPDRLGPFWFFTLAERAIFIPYIARTTTLATLSRKNGSRGEEHLAGGIAPQKPEGDVIA